MQTPHIPDTAERIGRVYGGIIYWSTIIAALLVIIGTTLSLLVMDDVLAPAYVFEAVLAGGSPADIWSHSVADMPDHYWYLKKPWHGDALVMLGIVTGVFSVIPACFMAAVLFFCKGQKYFGIMGLLTGGLILLPCLDLL